MNYDMKQTELWARLSSNESFMKIYKEKEATLKAEESYNSKIATSIEGDNLIMSIDGEVVKYPSGKMGKNYSRVEFAIDEAENLVVNECCGTLYSNNPFDFDRSDTGFLYTHYSSNLYTNDGIELEELYYTDQYDLDSASFNVQKNGFSAAVMSAYNPQLQKDLGTDETPKPSIIGKKGEFGRTQRTIDNLGLYKQSHIEFQNQGKGVLKMEDKYYFNSFLGSQAANTPLFMHYPYGYHFATSDENGNIIINDRYSDCDLTVDNYEEVAKRLYLKELQEELAKNENPKVQQQYKFLIDKVANAHVLDSIDDKGK